MLTFAGASLMPTNKSDILPSLVLSGPVSVPGMGSIIIIDAVIHSSAALNEASVFEEWQVCKNISFCLV